MKIRNKLNKAINNCLRHPFSYNLLATAAGFILCVVMTGCFTGIEGTKKITLSKEEKKLTAPTEEEKFFSGIKGDVLSTWTEGKRFLAADDKISVIFDQQGMPVNPLDLHLGGKELQFVEAASKIDAAGNVTAAIIFTDGARNYRYNTGKDYKEALERFSSDEIPMLIDLDMVESAKELLINKQLWTRSSLWYDDEGKRLDGKKYVPVTVTDIQAGNYSFPLKIKIKDQSGTEAWMYMNFGNSDTESRAFHNLFYLHDLRKHYPSISDETWAIICSEQIREGMTKEECKLAIGNPSEVSPGHDYSHTLDLWRYDDGSVLWFEDGLLTKFRR